MTATVVAPRRQEVLDAVKPVEGWLYLEEAWALHQAALSVAGQTAEPCMVEIGSWKGRSTVAIGLALLEAGRGRLHAIDPHTGSADHIAAHSSVDTFSEFMRNIEAADLDGVVTPVRSTSHRARSMFSGFSVNFLFVDGSHEYRDVLQDIEDWQPALAVNSLVAFNDVFCPGVSRALRERVVRIGSPYRRPRLAKNTLVFEYRLGAAWEKSETLAVARLRALMVVRRNLRRIRRLLPEPVVTFGHAVSERLIGVGS